MLSSCENPGVRFFKTLFYLLGLIPRPLAISLGNMLGQTVYALDRKHRRIVHANLRRALGHERQPVEIRSLARKVFMNLGQIIFEIGWSFHRQSTHLSRDYRFTGLEHYEKAFLQNRGVLAITAHMGNWELLPILEALTGFPSSIVFRPLDFAPLDAFFQYTRTRFGAKLIPNRQAMPRILRALKKNEAVALLMDQNVAWYEGVFVDFFGHRACTNKGLALIALRTGAPVVPVVLCAREVLFPHRIRPGDPAGSQRRHNPGCGRFHRTLQQGA